MHWHRGAGWPPPRPLLRPCQHTCKAVAQTLAPPPAAGPPAAALRGGTNILAEHGGSPLRLLVLLLLASPPTNLCLYALYARLTLAWNMAALPLLAAAPALLYGGPMCRRMLEVPGIEAPLDSLHSLLGLAQ